MVNASCVHKTRTCKRLDERARVDAALLNEVKGLPWRPVPGDPSVEEIPVTSHFEAPPVVAEIELPPVPISPAAPHSFHIRKERELVMYGYTPNCSGCRAARLGLGPQAHSLACRARIEGELAKTEAGRQRLQEHYWREQNARSTAIAPEQQATAAAIGSSSVPEGVTAAKASAASAASSGTGSGSSGSASSGSGHQASASGSAGSFGSSETRSTHVNQPSVPTAPADMDVSLRAGGKRKADAPPEGPTAVELDARESRPAAASVPQADSQNAGMDVGAVAAGGGGGEPRRGSRSGHSRRGRPDMNGTPRTQPAAYCDSYQAVQHEIATLLTALGCPNSKTAVSEIFSPGRFTSQASAFNLVSGSAFDLRTDWDLSCPKQQKKCWDKVEKEDPYLLVGSPVCALQALRPNTPESWKLFQDLLRKSIAHLNFCMKL